MLQSQARFQSSRILMALRFPLLAASWLLSCIGPSLQVDSNPACIVPLDDTYAVYPLCARWCVGCDDGEKRFGHNCYYPSGQCCFSNGDSPLQQTVIAATWGCVSDACSGNDAQKAFEVWLKDCANKGQPARESSVPAGFEFKQFGM